MPCRLSTACHYRRGLRFFNILASELKQVYQTYISCSISNCCSASVLTFQRYQRNFPYTSHSPPAAAGWRTSVLRIRNLFLTAIRWDRVFETISVDILKSNILVGLNGFYTDTSFRNILEGKDFDQEHHLFSFIAALVDRAMGEQRRHPMTHDQAIFSELRHLSNRYTIKHILAPYSLNKVQHRIKIYKKFLRITCDGHCEIGL